MQLVFIAHRGCASFQIAYISVIVGHYQRALELACAGGVDSEISAKLHGASHPFGDVHERSVGEYGRVQSRVKIVSVAHH
jgi:hypothetical protein